MQNSIVLSVFMLAGLFSVGQLPAQDAKACASKSEKVSCVKAENACAPATNTTAAFHSPLILQAAMLGSMTSAQSKPSCQPVNCKSATTASANCDPSLCKKLTCDPKDCPPECKPLCRTAASVAENADVKGVKCQAAPAKTKVALAEGS